MIGWHVLGVLSLSLNGQVDQDCASHLNPEVYHTQDVCSAWIEREEAYSVTVHASLLPEPASQQILLYQHERKWKLRVAGFRWKWGGEVSTRRNEFVINAEDAHALIDQFSDGNLSRLRTLPYYGEPNRICMDGSKLELAKAVAGQRSWVSQHSCAGATDMNAIAALFRQTALKYDPECDGLLYWLT